MTVKIYIHFNCSDIICSTYLSEMEVIFGSLMERTLLTDINLKLYLFDTYAPSVLSK